MSTSPDPTQSTDSTDSMDAEFDTVALWTAEVVAGLDPAQRIPAGCRGSGSPGALHWLLDHLRPERDQVFLDCGAGVGGPAAFAARETGVRPVLTDPEPGACRAARSLFGLPALQAGSQLPIATGAIGARMEPRGALHGGRPAGIPRRDPTGAAPEARFGLIVYCASHAGDLRLEAPEGNDLPHRRGAREHARPRIAAGAGPVAGPTTSPRSPPTGRT